ETADIAVVDRDPERLAALPAAIAPHRRYDSLTAALDDGFSPDVALMAFNDDQHFDAFRELERRAPGLKAVLSEKPLVETLEQARQLQGFFERVYLSMNTVIHFSPVFPLLRNALAQAAQEA